MFKRLFLCIILALFVFLLSGCDVFTADTAELFSPPSLSGELKAISDALKASAGNDYTLKYPSAGEYRSAVVQKDVNGDKIPESFAFYSKTDHDVITMNINVVCRDGEEWTSAGSQSIVAGGVDRIDFCDLDLDGSLEILVGWQIYGNSEMQLAVYSFKDNVLTQRLLNKYTHFIVCDLDNNEKSELLILDMNTTDSINTALLYDFSSNGVSQIGNCQLDSNIQSIGEPVLAELSSGKNAVYIDSVKGLGAITEVLCFEQGQLVNPLFDKTTRETSATLRSIDFSTKDINDDGVLEIPVQLNVPAVAKGEVTEKLYLTKWCSFNGEQLTVKKTSMINIIDGFDYTIPEKWIGNIAVLKDTKNSVREIYAYNAEEMTIGEELLYIKAVKKKDWDDGKYAPLKLQKITESDKTVFACEIYPKGVELGLTLEKVKNDFKLYKQE